MRIAQPVTYGSVGLTDSRLYRQIQPSFARIPTMKITLVCGWLRDIFIWPLSLSHPHSGLVGVKGCTLPRRSIYNATQSCPVGKVL